MGHSFTSVTLQFRERVVTLLNHSDIRVLNHVTDLRSTIYKNSE